MCCHLSIWTSGVFMSRSCVSENADNFSFWKQLVIIHGKKECLTN